MKNKLMSAVIAITNLINAITLLLVVVVLLLRL